MLTGLFIFMLLLLGYGFFVYRALSSKNDVVAAVEKEVATEMERRSHQLCLQAYDMQGVAHYWQRSKMDEEFQDNLHLYMEDYQAAVAERLKQKNIRGLTAYGFIQLKE
jgi:di/tricarboxylate transporter